MKVWVVSQVAVFAFGANGRTIIAVYDNEKEANRHAATHSLLVSQPYEVKKKWKKVKKDPEQGKQQPARS